MIKLNNPYIQKRSSEYQDSGRSKGLTASKSTGPENSRSWSNILESNAYSGYWTQKHNPGIIFPNQYDTAALQLQ